MVFNYYLQNQSSTWLGIAIFCLRYSISQLKFPIVSCLYETVLFIMFLHTLAQYKSLLHIKIGEHDRERLSTEKEQVAPKDTWMVVMMMSPF